MGIGEKMKVLVTGVGGQLGYDVIKELTRRKIDCIGADLQEFDITDYDAAYTFITEYQPDAIIHCSAYTAVDKAEDEPEICHRVNALGTENIAKICKEINSKRPLYKQVGKVRLRKSEFKKNTSKKILRYNRKEQTK